MNERFKGLENIKGLYFPNDNDIDKMVDCLYDSYMSVDYPLTHYFFIDKFFNEKILKDFWKTTIVSMKNEALFIADSPEINGLSVWLTEGFKGSKIIPFIICGAYKLPLAAWYKMFLYEVYSMRLKYKYTKHKSWYLYNIGVRGSHQSHGLANKMVLPVLDYLKSAKKNCYLETHSKYNVPIYEKLGFQLMEVGCVPKSKLAHYAFYTNNNYENEE